MTTRPLSTAQQLALAVLTGDDSAVGPLLDCLTEQYGVDARPLPALPSIQRLQVDDPSCLRAVFYVKDDAEMDQQAATELQSGWQAWLAGETPALALNGIDRVELYQVPPEVSRIALQELRDRQHRERQELRDRQHRERDEMRRHMAEHQGVIRGLEQMAQSRFPQQPAEGDLTSQIAIVLGTVSDEQLRAEMRRRGEAALQAQDQDTEEDR